MGFGKMSSPQTKQAINIIAHETEQKSNFTKRGGSLMVDREQDKFWGNMMNDDVNKFRQQSELKKMENRASNLKLVAQNRESVMLKQNVKYLEKTTKQMYGNKVGTMSKNELDYDRLRKENRKVVIRENQQINQAVAQKKMREFNRSSEAEKLQEKLKAQVNDVKDEIKAASEVRVGREKIKKQKHMLDDLVTERAKKREKERYPLTEEKLKSIEIEIS